MSEYKLTEEDQRNLKEASRELGLAIHSIEECIDILKDEGLDDDAYEVATYKSKFQEYQRQIEQIIRDGYV